MTFTTLTLKDAITEAMKKEGHSPEEVAELCDVSENTVRNFLSGRTSSLHEDTQNSFEEYCSAYGITRGAIMKKMQGRKKVQPVKYVLHAREIIKKLIADGKIKPGQFLKEAGIPHGYSHQFWNGQHKVISKTARAALQFLEQRYGITVDKLNQMMLTGQITVGEPVMGGVVEAQDEKGNTVFTKPGEGRHYICAYLDDWESASTISSIMGNPALPESEKKKLLGKLFKQEFPTLS